MIAKYQETRASLENLQRILAQEPAPQNPGGAVPDGIESLEFSQGQLPAPGARERGPLRRLLRGARRERASRSSAPRAPGKARSSSCLLGLYRPDSGRILFNGVDSRDVNYDLLRTRVGFVPQSIELFAGTIRDNLRFVRREATDEECMESLKAAQLHGLLERSRQGLDTRIGEGGLKLSGGERQRLAIARALLRKPDILIFDEATSSLDTETEKEITRTIDQIIRTRPRFVTLLIAHRLSTVAAADRIVVLKKGRVMEQGSHQELLRIGGLYYTLWQQQGLEGEDFTPAVAAAG